MCFNNFSYILMWLCRKITAVNVIIMLLYQSSKVCVILEMCDLLQLNVMLFARYSVQLTWSPVSRGAVGVSFSDMMSNVV